MKRQLRFMENEQKDSEDDDPLSGTSNLFDVAMVFAVGLMVALVSYQGIPEMLNADSDLTLIKNPGSPDMEIITKTGEEIEILKATNESYGGVGEILGTAYRLPNGEIIYVPEDAIEDP